MDMIRITSIRMCQYIDVPDKCSTKFVNIPFYKGAQLWNALSDIVQRSENLNIFSEHVKQIYKVYTNLLENNEMNCEICNGAQLYICLL